MRRHINNMISQLVIECNETFAIAFHLDNDEWTAILFAVESPEQPLFDRRGDLQLAGRGASIDDALDALELRCAIV